MQQITPNTALTDRLYRFIWREEPVPSPSDLAALARELLEEIHRLAPAAPPPPSSAQLSLIENE